MKIYRVENKINMGPFKKGLPYPYSKNWNNKRPQVDNVVMSSNLYCGCKSIEDLRFWFPSNSYAALMFFGYNAYEMEICTKNVKVCATTNQIIFNKNMITNKNSINLY